MATLLRVNKIKKSYGAQVVFENACLNVSEKEKIAIVGRNGAGKSTLFRIIVDLEEADSGEINIHSKARVGYLTQDNPYELSETVIGFLMRSSGRPDYECAKIAGKFQIKGDMLEKEIGSFAGGYQTRVKLISMLLEDPNILLLDEPTNYLDINTQLLLEKFLQKYKGAFLIISHDREFIRKTCTQTVEIDQGKITKFPQAIDLFLTYKEDKIASQQKFNVKIEREKKHLQKFVDRFAAKASKASQAKSKRKQIERLKTVDILHPLASANIRIPQIESKKGIALILDDLSIGYQDKVVSQNISLEIDRGEHIAVLGNNGQGKSTLLKTIAGELEPIKGTAHWAAEIKIGYYAQHVPATMDPNICVKSYLESSAPPDVTDQEIFEMAGNFLFRDEALDKMIKVLSGGEKARLCLAALLLEKNHILLMDEPTNHLDFETVEALASSLKQTRSAVVFVSHNRTFIDILAKGIIEVKNGKVRRFSHDYKNYIKQLQSQIDEDDYLEKINDGNSPPSKNKMNKDNKLKIKKARSELRSIEKDLGKVDKEKEELIKWFEENYSKFSQEKNERLAFLTDHHAKLESKWMEVQLEIDELS